MKIMRLTILFKRKERENEKLDCTISSFNKGVLCIF